MTDPQPSEQPRTAALITAGEELFAIAYAALLQDAVDNHLTNEAMTAWTRAVAAARKAEAAAPDPVASRGLKKPPQPTRPDPGVREGGWPWEERGTVGQAPDPVASPALDVERLARALIDSDLMPRYREYAMRVPTMDPSETVEHLAAVWAGWVAAAYALEGQPVAKEPA